MKQPPIIRGTATICCRFRASILLSLDGRTAQRIGGRPDGKEFPHSVLVCQRSQYADSRIEDYGT